MKEKEEKIEQYKQKVKEIEKRYEEKLYEKDKLIDRLEIKLNKFEDAVISNEKTVYNHNDNRNICLNLSSDNVKRILDENLTPSVVGGGQKGLAHMIYNNMLKGNYICTDPSRQIFEFFNKDGELEKDVKAAKLSKALIESDLKQKAYVQSNKIWTKDNGEHDSDRFNASIGKASELINFNDDNKKFRSELTILAST